MFLRIARQTKNQIISEYSRGQPRLVRQEEVLRHFQDFREKFWSKFWISLYVLDIFISPSAQNREKSASLGRLFSQTALKAEP